MSRYKSGMEVLGGDGLLDVIPGLSMLTKSSTPGTPAAGAQSTQDQIKAALEQERMRRATEKAEADASESKVIMFGLLGALGVGGLVFFLKK